MGVSARKPDAAEDAVRPGSPWLRLVVVIATLAIAAGLGAMVVAIAE